MSGLAFGWLALLQIHLASAVEEVGAAEAVAADVHQEAAD